MRIGSLLMFVCTYLLAVCADPFSFKGSNNSIIGVYISDLRNGKVIAEYNSDRSMIPASVQKCVTSASAQLLLPPDAPFTTRMMVRGEIDLGVLAGNLYIIGGGDPTLGSRHFSGRSGFVSSVVAWLKDLGVDSIAGDVVMDGSRYPTIGVSPYWLLEDTAWEYGAGIYGINFRDNSFTMTLRPDGKAADALNNVDVINLLKLGDKNDVQAMRGEGSSMLTVMGTLSTTAYTSRYSTPFPEWDLYDEIVSALSRSDIGLGGKLVDEAYGQERHRDYESPDRDEILKVMMFKSDNLFAEGMLRAMIVDSSERTFSNGVDVEKRLWTGAGVDLSGVRWLDGSGLAPVNRMSPKTLSAILGYMSKSAKSKEYVALFPRVGKEGTVARLLAKTRLAGKLALKSGSMNGVLCYAGYKLDESGRPSHSVVVMVNGASCGSSEIRTAIGRYLLTLF
ncbi:MAG: D-alanyl-D-alanine carboxypeptidase/D-alanyl-D-alanine-endopeptidase [Muribaculum sp.]|nr:D-alanyl-D-alanine carboxypeptidase/D-alanyl-D-alanine-endopeptidase [Muribaculum sp.]